MSRLRSRRLTSSLRAFWSAVALFSISSGIAGVGGATGTAPKWVLVASVLGQFFGGEAAVIFWIVSRRRTKDLLNSQEGQTATERVQTLLLLRAWHGAHRATRDEINKAILNEASRAESAHGTSLLELDYGILVHGLSPLPSILRIDSDKPVAILVLDAMRSVGHVEAIPYVKRFLAFSSEGELRSATQQCLRALQKTLLSEKDRNGLLRAAEIQADDGTLLLRPAGGTSSDDVSKLVSPSQYTDKEE